MKNDYNQINIRVPRETYDKLKEIKNKSGFKITSIVRQAIGYFLANRREEVKDDKR